jgi:dimethylhistidine N-methyltransferase
MNGATTPTATDEAPELTDYDPNVADEAREILAGLAEPQKRVSPKYFYDQRGSELFDRICELPEYYPTRTELRIMREHHAAIAEAVGPDVCLIELGSGSSLKTRLLLRSLPRVAAYVPVDISREHLQQAAADLAADFPDVEVLPVCADFTQPFELPTATAVVRKNVVYFPGSTIGNFDPDAARALLDVVYREAGPGGGLLIGVDLQKSKDILERAYNDGEGVTAEFNLNLLRRFNRELDADFDLAAFRHFAVYDAAHGRIEMHLESLADQTVTVAGRAIPFERGETILTEYSHKYTLEGFAEFARESGFEREHVWTDDDALFSIQYLRAV